jgi:hypothetical protein
MPPKPPTKKAIMLKRAAEELDDALFDSPVHKKKSKTNLAQPDIIIPDQIVPPPVATVANPRFIQEFEPESALRLTKAQDAINFAEDKINFYSDLLVTFNNTANDPAIATADRANDKIAKWDARRDKVQKTMDVLLKIAPKKKANNAILPVDVAEGFLSSG